MERAAIFAVVGGKLGHLGAAAGVVQDHAPAPGLVDKSIGGAERTAANALEARHEGHAVDDNGASLGKTQISACRMLQNLGPTGQNRRAPVQGGAARVNSDQLRLDGTDRFHGYEIARLEGVVKDLVGKQNCILVTHR